MINTIYDVDSGNNFSFIKWRLTEACNFHCSYCIRRTMVQKSQELQQAQKDWEICKKVLPEVNRIIEELPGEKVKIDLIGGEITLFPLNELISGLTSSKLSEINITTNLSASVNYFKQLIDYCASRKIKFSVTASYHAEFITLDTYITKMKELNEYISDYFILSGETVSLQDNQDIVQAYITRMNESGLTYMVDSDKTKPCRTLLTETSQDKPLRYRVIYDTGEVKDFNSRGMFIDGVYDNHPLLNRCILRTEGMYCSRDYDYVYIEKNLHNGNGSNSKRGCKHYTPIQYFHVRKQPTMCQYKWCTLCGHFSLSYNPDKLLRPHKED